MLNVQRAYARDIDGKYEVFSSHLSADEIDVKRSSKVCVKGRSYYDSKQAKS